MPQQTEGEDGFEPMKERQITNTLTDEFLNHMCGIQDPQKQIQIVKDLARELENTLSVVCDVESNRHGVDVRVFRTCDANTQRVQRALQDMQSEIAHSYAEN